jgi:hypothetical protein
MARNSEPWSDRIAGGEGKPGYLEVSDPVAQTVRAGEIFLREQMRGFKTWSFFSTMGQLECLQQFTNYHKHIL